MRFTTINEINDALREKYNDTSLVFGEGPVPCPIMIAGEAPGGDEIVKGHPFTGQAGKNFDGFMKILGLTRDDIYISNVCKFRPFRVSDKGTISNRAPTKREIMEAAPFIKEEIRLVDPKLLIVLGNTPLHACTGDFSLRVGDVHGTCLHVDIDGVTPCVFALYHPASIIYRPALKSVYEEDLQVLKEHIEALRTETAH